MNLKMLQIGYTLDVGLMDGKWSLVEVNDGWAIGF